MKTPLHIIIEGVDGTGKSTICKLLSKKLKIPVVKMQSMPEHFKSNPEAASKIFNETIEQFKSFSFILDRGYLSSIAYSTVYRRPMKDLYYIPGHAENMKYSVFILSKDKPFRGDELISNKEIKALQAVYKSIAKAIKCEIIDVSILTPKQVCQKILNLI